MENRTAWKHLLVVFVAYTRQAWRARKRLPQRSFTRAMLLFPRWVRSLNSSPLSQRTPWMSYAAIRALEQTLVEEMNVFEWGVGGSTLFFSERVRSVISVEHDREWAREASDAMATAGCKNWELMVMPPHARTDEPPENPADPLTYASSLPDFFGLSFRNYACAIDKFPNEHFDVVVVDGRCRPSCALHGLNKVKFGGYLLIDDADRERYRWIGRELTRLGWSAIDFHGPGPCLTAFQTTSIWQRVESTEQA